MSERARCVIFMALMVLAVVGAIALMASGLLTDPMWRMRLQVVATSATLGCGAACAILAWRWWSDRFLEDRRTGR